MNQRNKLNPNFPIILIILTLLLASLACGLDFGNSDNDAESLQLEQTRVALQQTQIALDAIAQEPPTEEPVVVTEEPDEPVVQPDVSYEGISFSFDDNIAASVSSETIPGQNMGEDYMPGETYPTYAKFSFNDYATGDHFHTPVIAVYPVSEYRAISTGASDTIDNLQATLVNRPSGGSLSHLPFLPIWNAAQLFSAKVSYFD